MSSNCGVGLLGLMGIVNDIPGLVFCGLENICVKRMKRDGGWEENAEVGVGEKEGGREVNEKARCRSH